METLNCIPTMIHRDNNVDDVVDTEIKRCDVHFKRNLLTMKSEDDHSHEMDVDGGSLCDEEVGFEEDDGDDDSDEYGECYDGPYHFLSDDYDDCDFTPQELQEFMFEQQQQQQSMYSTRRYSLLETIQEETYDELRMSSISDESTSCRSDYSGVWCWGDDYPDDGTESVVTRPNNCREEEIDPVFDSDTEENPLSDREGSWLDIDNSSEQQKGTMEKVCDAENIRSESDQRVLETLPANTTIKSGADTETATLGESTEMFWSDAIDAYLMSRANTDDKVTTVEIQSCTGSAKLPNIDLCFESSNDNIMTSKESASSLLAKDEFIGFRFNDDIISRLSGVKSTPDLTADDPSEDVYTSSLQCYANDDSALKTVSNLSFVGTSDIIGWNDDVTKSQSLPCVHLYSLEHQLTNHSISVSQVTPSLAFHLDRVDSNNAVDECLFICEDNEGEASEDEEEDDFSSDESGDQSSVYCNRSQTSLPFLRYTTPAAMRSFRSFDTLHLAGTMGLSPDDSDDDNDDVVEEEMQEVCTGKNSYSTGLRLASKSCEDLSEDSGCFDIALSSSKCSTICLEKTQEDCENEQNVDFSDIQNSHIVQLAADEQLAGDIEEKVNRAEEVEFLVGVDETDQLPVSYQFRNVSENSQICSTVVSNLKTGFGDVTSTVNQSTAIVLDVLMNTGSGINPTCFDADVHNNEHEQIIYNHIATLQHSPIAIESHENDFGSCRIDELQKEKVFGGESIDLISTFDLSSAMSDSKLFNDQAVHHKHTILDDEEDIERLRVRRSLDSSSGGWVLMRLSSSPVHTQSEIAQEFQSAKHSFESSVNMDETDRFLSDEKLEDLLSEKPHRVLSDCVSDALPASNCAFVSSYQENKNNGGEKCYVRQVQLPSTVDISCEVEIEKQVENISIEICSSASDKVGEYSALCSEAQNSSSLIVDVGMSTSKVSEGLIVREDDSCCDSSPSNKNFSENSELQTKNNLDDMVKEFERSVHLKNGQIGAEQSANLSQIEISKDPHCNGENASNSLENLKSLPQCHRQQLRVNESEKKAGSTKKTETTVEKEKDKKKGAKKSWWFLPKSKQSEPTTDTKKGKISTTVIDGNTTSNDKHLVNCEENSKRRSEKKPELTELETTRLDMETFTNNLWIEFESQLEGVWPSANLGQNQHASATHVTSILAPENIIEEIHVQTSNIDKCCLDASEVNMKSVGTEEESKNQALVNHVVRGKPPLPPTSPSSMPNSREKVALKLSEKEISNEEEVNDPSLVFDKFRQIAKEGRDRAAKSIQNLDDVEDTFRKANEESVGVQEKVSSPVIDEICQNDENSWSSTPFWSNFDENYAAEMSMLTSTSNKHLTESCRSLVGYLETDIDTFHSREVIRILPSNASLSSNRNVSNSSLNFGSNVKRHRPVKLKTQSMFNLLDGNERHLHVEQSDLLTTEMSVIDEDLMSTGSSRAKSMEFLLKAENKAAVEAPENRLMRLKVAPTAYRNGEAHKTNGTDVETNKTMSEHEERIRRSLHKLNLPEWYTNSRLHQNGSSEYLRKDGEERRGLRWESFRNRSTSSSSIYSGGNGVGKARSATNINKRLTTPDWRTMKSSQESLVQSPSSPTSSIQFDKTNDGSQNYYTFGMSRWGSSRMSTNSSRSSSPTSGLNGSSYSRSSLKHQPYLGWRSSEKLAALASSPSAKENQKPNFYRTAAERLSKGPGYYALRFGVYNSSNGGESDLSLV